MAPRLEETCCERDGLRKFSCLPKDYRNDDAGVARGTVFQEVWPGAGFKTGDFVKEKLGGEGATVERLSFSE